MDPRARQRDRPWGLHTKSRTRTEASYHTGSLDALGSWSATMISRHPESGSLASPLFTSSFVRLILRTHLASKRSQPSCAISNSERRQYLRRVGSIRRGHVFETRWPNARRFSCAHIANFPGGDHGGGARVAYLSESRAIPHEKRQHVGIHPTSRWVYRIRRRHERRHAPEGLSPPPPAWCPRVRLRVP